MGNTLKKENLYSAIDSNDEESITRIIKVNQMNINIINIFQRTILNLLMNQ